MHLSFVAPENAPHLMVRVVSGMVRDFKELHSKHKLLCISVTPVGINSDFSLTQYLNAPQPIDVRLLVGDICTIVRDEHPLYNND